MDTVDRSTLIASWSKEQTLLLLKELQNHPMLYDQTHPLYKFRTHRLAALKNIITKLRPLKPHLTPKYIAKKIRVLKSQYWKEKQNIRISLANQKPGRRPYKPKLWCYDLLKFFDQKGAHIDLSAPSIPEADDDDMQEEVEALDEVEIPEQIRSFEEVELEGLDQRNRVETQKGQTRDMLRTRCLNLMKCLTKEVETVAKVSGTKEGAQPLPSTFLGLMVESELSKVTEEIYEDAKWKIIRVLAETSKKCREMRANKTSEHAASTSTSPSSLSYNLGSATRVTVIPDNHTFKIPQTPIGSKQKNVIIIRPILNKQ